jgi:CxxC motif-containing protein (DUF1111 family)
MKKLKLMIVLFSVVVFALTATFTNNASSQQSDQESRSPVDGKTRRERFSHNGALKNEDTPRVDNGQSTSLSKDDLIGRATEALTGFDNLTNGYTEQGPPFEILNGDNVVALRSHNDNRFIFEEFETIGDGVGPTYNAQSCRECHQNVVTGGASQVTVQRTGRTQNGQFFESQGGSLIHSRATYPDIVELVAFADTTRTFRISPGTLGDGYVEAIANSTLLAIRDGQTASLRGNAVMVPVLEGTGEARIGRFGWKSQHASLVSFAVDAYLNEMGITTPLLPEENTSSGHFVGYGSGYDPLPEPEDDGADANAFADFMRATKAPARGNINADVQAGDRLFRQVGCSVCHVASITTARPGSIINGGAFIVPEALGNKIIHPYSDFLLHNIGTGDGIPIQPTHEYAVTANQIRTAPLWGLRTRNRLMHDGLTFTLQEAIQRHAGQAASVTSAYTRLTTAQKNQLLAFLNSL